MSEDNEFYLCIGCQNEFHISLLKLREQHYYCENCLDVRVRFLKQVKGYADILNSMYPDVNIKLRVALINENNDIVDIINDEEYVKR